MTPEQLVVGVEDVVSLPEVCMRVNEMVDDPTYNANRIGEVISQDSGLTVRLLKIVNSAFYNFPRKIETVSRAIAIIGTKELRDMVLATSAVKAFDSLPNEIVDMVQFWRHSLYTGVTARILAKECRVLHAERLFVAGLLHAIGRLIIYHELPQQSHQVFALMHEKGICQWEAEEQIIGFNYTQVGYELARKWQLPESLQTALRWHLAPEQAPDHPLETSIIHLAQGIATMADMEEPVLPHLSDQAWQLTGLSPDTIDGVMVEAGVQFAEALSLVLPPKYQQ